MSRRRRHKAVQLHENLVERIDAHLRTMGKDAPSRSAFVAGVVEDRLADRSGSACHSDSDATPKTP